MYANVILKVTFAYIRLRLSFQSEVLIQQDKIIRLPGLIRVGLVSRLWHLTLTPTLR